MQHLQKSLLLAILVTSIAFSLAAQNSNFQLRSTLTFPNQTLANVCGWTSPTGKEYALVGASKGLIIVDITNPDAPQQIVQIPGPDNLWKEIKTFSHYAYVTSEGGGGVQIVDLNGLPSATLLYHNYTGTGEIAGQINAIHALHIDVNKGFLYTYGGDFSFGQVHDLNADPYNPTYVGKFDQLGYIHDGYADNDTLYACHIYTGLLSIVDMKDKDNPQLLGTIQTPGKFTHNSWLLSDHRYILTTDEALPSFVTSYDISDPTDIKELDRFSIDNGSNSIGHNVQIINDYTVTSWYTGGVVITDVHRPQNLVKVAQYDTWSASGPDFDGCWGAYPYFPSGTVIASNIEPGQLFILTPTYVRACYLEGIVRDGCNNLPLSGAKVVISGGVSDLSNAAGIVRTGQVTPGAVTVTISKNGYTSQTLNATLVNGQVSEFDVTLAPMSAFNLSGSVVDAVSGLTLANIPVTISNAFNTYTEVTNGSGQFTLDCALSGTYSVTAGKWGYIANSQSITINGNTTVTISLSNGYFDDFNLDYGWTSSATSPSGLWTRGEPVGTTQGGQFSNPEFDVDTDNGDQCYVTGNGGGQPGSDDVDNGSVTLVSPTMKLAGLSNALLTFNYWFFNGGGNGTPNDHFTVRVNNGQTTAVILNQTVSESEWRSSGAIYLADLIALTDNMTVEFIAADDTPGHLVEGGVDVFSVIPTTSGTIDINNAAQLTASPNPSSNEFSIRYDWPNQSQLVIEVRNILGQVVTNKAVSSSNGTIQVGQGWPKGVYTAILTNGQQQSTVLKLVKG